MERRSPSVLPGDALPENPLRLDLQLCFRLYAASRLITRLYQPMLEPHGLTYPQYIVLMILWEDAPCPVSHIGERALLNTNTLTPLLKRLEQQGLVQRQRRQDDERIVEIHLTEAGHALRSQCACVPTELAAKAHFPPQKIEALAALLDELLARLGGL
ncbi:MarR family winged helix-turn-helix transcriptional regulator [Stutzerimonas stutzeri]|jgi:DNA-binding MarR family transcriptional regulator|uniref:MarR family winged helix-turn-helix transcriptional regulator n=1 Tax=Stutzerimonas stutzeri TaxID=316 RepID=UPI00036F11A2|nr:MULTISPECIES: MarR family transcriptional regulator [Pseudomonadaceae]MDM9652804.1 MarR family transcriptional regulator [Pseudomonas wenzhouensis]